ncbi:SAV_2336 N-terminal domain-related protein [Spirillospora sp. NPDC048819]|uniref:SAV_2336 N-terminal domain-related protein n=1 Tax=Spirillospora sp. NPDC048819 TaxID=3155268 RepID=UPI0033EF772E
MTIDRFREVLEAAGPPPDARELSEMLWLACHISPPGQDAPPDPPVPPPKVSEQPANSPGLATPPARTPPPPPTPLRALHPRPTAEAEPGAEAEQVLVPTAPMLADPLGVQRALRPLKRRVPSRHRVELDEDATAARIADTRMWTPVLVPSPERWLSLSLVVDTGPTMRLWRPLARELTEALLRQGAFQNVHVSYLDTTGRITSTPDAPPQDPGTLLDASGRQAALILSDCSGPHWWDGRAGRAVRRWARSGPTAILQPLAERLWRRTAAPASPGVAALPRPGAPNTDLRFTPYDGVAAPGVPVPVLEVAPRWLGAWARLVSGSDPQPAAITTLPSRPSGTAPLHRERELPIGERVSRFLATASPDAAELAAHVAVSVPSLPVMRLIQHRILGGSAPGQLAEVLLSGLLRPAGGARYEFVPGARDALLDTLPRPEALHTRHVLEAVSAEIERRAGTSAETFRALLPAEGGPVTLTADTDHFALLTPETRSHLAPASQPSTAVPSLLDIQGATVDELLGENWDRPPHSTAIGLDGNAETVWLDVLRGGRFGPHGMITGPRRDRDALLRTIVFSLALRHSPNVVTFAFADCTGGTSFAGPENLPHVAAAVHTTSAESPLIGRLPAVLETERRRREAVLREAGTPSWGDYQAAIAEGRPLAPLPALIVIVDDTGPLLEARPDLIEPFMALCEERPAHGIRFVFCSPDEVALLADLVAWRIEVPGGTGSASLEVYGERSDTNFRPAHISLDAVDPIVERMRQQGPQAGGLPGLAEPAQPDTPVGTPAAPETEVPESDVHESDVLELNGGGSLGSWALPASTPRNPAIGLDPEGNAVSLYPLDLSAGIPHGLIVGDTRARQHVLRVIALALATAYSPSDLTLAVAGLGEHPFREPLALPHVRYSDDELLGSPQKLQRFTEFLSDELRSRAEAPSPGDLPRLLVVADVSLTFPSSRPVVAETLLSLAQRGRALGVQLLVSSSTVEGTMIWNRFLPLLGWRIAAGRMPPSLQRVLGRASLPFPDERTAYLLAGGGSPRRFTLAPDPPGQALRDFIVRTTHHHADETLPDLLMTDPRGEDGGVMDVLRRLCVSEIAARRWGQHRPRHLVYAGTDEPRIARLATLYGQMLAALGVLSHGNVREATVGWSGHVTGEPGTTMTDLFRGSRGGVLLLHMSRVHDDTAEDATGPGFHEELRLLSQEYGEDPVIVLCADAGQMTGLRGFDPTFRDRFRRFTEFPRVRPQTEELHRSASDRPAAVRGSAPPVVTGGRIPIGIETGTREPAFVDFNADRHLLISGPSGTGKTTVMRGLIDGLLSRPDADGTTLVYVFDRGGSLWSPSRTELWERPGLRYTTWPEDFTTLISEALRATRERLRSGTGPEVYVFIAGRNHLLGEDPLRPVLPQLSTTRERGLHLVLLRHRISLGDPLDPMVTMLRAFGSPVLLTGHAGGHEAELWEVPDALQGPLPLGQAVLAHPDRHRIIELPEPS